MKGTQTSRVRVLVVDDFEPWRRYILPILQEAKFDVIGEGSRYCVTLMVAAFSFHAMLGIHFGP